MGRARDPSYSVGSGRVDGDDARAHHVPARREHIDDYDLSNYDDFNHIDHDNYNHNHDYND